MSSDSEVGSDFLEGLKEMGLFDGEIPKSEKTKDKAKKKANNAAKKRPPPKRKPINLDALMDGIELSGIADTKPPAPAESITLKQDFPIYSVVSSPITVVEKNIESYLNRSVKILMDEFTVELTHMLDSNGEFDQQTEDWLDTLKQTVREEIALQQKGNDVQKANVLVGIDTIGIGFKEVFQEAEMHKNISIPQKLREVRSSNASISSHLSALKTQISFNELSEEIKSLNDARSKLIRQTRSNAKRSRSLFLNVLELEAEKERQNTESQIIEQKLSRINESRKRLEDADFEYGNSDMKSDVKAKMRELIDSLTTRILDKPQTPVTWQFRAVDDAREKSASTRRAYELGLDQLLMRLESIPMVTAPSMSVSHGQSQRMEPRVTEVSANDKTLMHVREALNDFQKRRQMAIESTTEFLSAIKRKERKRVEREAARTASRNLDMNTLFSVL